MSPIQRWKRTERRGNYTMMMGGLMFVVVGFAAFAVDIGLITMSELQSQATADAASHAALVMFRETHDYDGDPSAAIAAGNAAAQWIVDHNDVGMGHAELESGNPVYGQFDYSTSLFQPGFWPNGGANAVRVEVARTAILDDVSVLSERAGAVSRWILAERAPLALPDARWDRMVYGIRDCEEYLRATAS